VKIFDISIVDDIMLKQIFDESRKKNDERGFVGDDFIEKYTVT